MKGVFLNNKMAGGIHYLDEQPVNLDKIPLRSGEQILKLAHLKGKEKKEVVLHYFLYSHFFLLL